MSLYVRQKYSISPRIRSIPKITPYFSQIFGIVSYADLEIGKLFVLFYAYRIKKSFLTFYKSMQGMIGL